MREVKKTKVLFVCMGNICRSPTAEGVFLKKLRDAGRESEFEVDSAGTHSYHVGSSPDGRAQAAARLREVELRGLRARRVSDQDFLHYDLILGMDHANLGDLEAVCPPENRHKLRLMLEFGGSERDEVPDPYYGGDNGFEVVLDLLEDATDGLLEYLARDRLETTQSEC